jgi:cell division septal protein FtsQ
VFFKINTINITGEKFYSNQQIAECAEIEIGDNLFSVNEKKLNEVLAEKLPYIKNVKVTRKLPDTLNIQVSLTREVAALINGDGYLLVDASGKVLDSNASMLRENVAVVSGVKVKKAQEGRLVELNNNGVTQDFITIVSTLEESDFAGITVISLSPKSEFRLVYEDRITIKLGAMENLAVKLQRAKVAIDKENQTGLKTKGVLDLSTEPDVYFRPGDDVELTIPPEFVTDKDGNVQVDENGDFLTTQGPAEAVTEETTQLEE